MKASVLFVCLGNICRSPMAEGIFLHLLEENGLAEKYFVDSAGTADYHLGELPDNRMRETALKHNIELTRTARQASPEDFHVFDYIVAMDHENRRNLEKIMPENPTAKLIMMRDFDDQSSGAGVPDPYYGGLTGFENVFQLLYVSNKRFLDHLENEFKDH